MKRLTMKAGVALVLALFFLLNPIMSFAHGCYYLQTVIDDTTFTYSGGIWYDTGSKILGRESDHMEYKTADFTPLIKDNNVLLPDTYTESSLTSESQYMVFSFPAMEVGEGWFSSATKSNATTVDAARARMVQETLTQNLNDAMSFMNGGYKFKAMNNFLEVSKSLTTAIRNSVANGGSAQVVNNPEMTNRTFKLTAGKRTSYSKGQTDDTKTGIRASDYVLISAYDKSGLLVEENEFVYRMEKGYKASTWEWDNSVFKQTQQQGNVNNLSGDTQYITWNMMVYQAQYLYTVKQISASEANAVAKPGVLESAVSDMLQSVINGIRNLLGLYSMNDLLYNEGVRGSSAWYYGAMPMAWQENVMVYHYIFQALAWTVITLAIAKLLISRNLATINPSSRVSLITGVQDLLVTGVVLAFVMPLIGFLLMINGKLVDIFAAVGPDLDNMTGLNESTGFLAGVLLQIFYLFIMIWLNFTYIMRSITIAMLTALSPIFIVTLAFGGKWKMMFSNFMKELNANIFLQSFHAFVMGFLYLSQLSSRGIEMIVICLAMMPLTEFFRSLIMGNAGGTASKLGLGSVTALGGMAMDTTKSLVGRKRVEEGGRSKSISDTATQNPSGKETPGAGGMSDSRTANSDKLQNRTKHQDTLKVQNEKQVPLDIAAKGKDSKEYQDFMGGGVKQDSEHAAKVADFKDNLKSDLKRRSLGESAASVGAGGMRGLGMMTAAAYGMAFGLSDKAALAQSGKALGQLAEKPLTALKNGKDFVSGNVKEGLKLAKEGRELKREAKLNGSPFNGGGGTPMRTTAMGSGIYRPVTSGQAALPYGGVGGQSNLPVTADQHPTTGRDGSSTGQNRQSAPVDQGEMMNGIVWAKSLGNGNSEVYRDSDVLSEQGIVRGREDQNGHAVYTYEPNKLSNHDRDNMKAYMSTFASNDETAKEHLREHGVENAWISGDDKFVVSYNNAGKEKLGIQSVRTSGGHLIETKRADQSMQTKVSVDIPPLLPKLGSSGEAFQGRGQGQRNNNRQYNRDHTPRRGSSGGSNNRNRYSEMQ